MIEASKDEQPPYLLAAGGLVEKQSPEGLRIAVLHRLRSEDQDGSSGDWVLPKGKHELERDKSLRDTALREVEEETGCTVSILDPCFPSEYLAGGIPKLVLFFRMSCLAEGPVTDALEVDVVSWPTPAQALTRLTYDSERNVVRQAYPDLVDAGNAERST